YGYVTGVAVDPSAPTVAYLTGGTASTSFPVTSSAYQSTLPSSGNIGFVTRLDTSAGTGGLRYSTYLGGTASGSFTQLSGIAQRAGLVAISGTTFTNTYPAVNAFQSGFAVGGGDAAVVTEIDTGASGTASLKYSSYLSGSQDARGLAVAFDAAG